ncbi:MAG: cytochrome c oxidase subunit II [Acidobacteriaceae bacterium]
MALLVLAHPLFAAAMGFGHHGFSLHGSADPASSPTSMFSPAATPSHSIVGLTLFVFVITGVIFLAVGGVLLYSIIRFRARSAVTYNEPTQVYGSPQIEVAWTVVPVLIVLVLFLTTLHVILQTETAKKPKDALTVLAIGHQFWFEYRYPKLGIVTANELHVPVSDTKTPLPTYLELSSADVDHSFWVPRLAGKMDMIPNRVNTMWIDPHLAGLYLGQCAQFCGVEHAKMLIRVYAESPQDFAAWAKNQEKPAVEDPRVAEGKAVFLRNACANCHAIRGTMANGRFGPDLTHLMSRDTLAAGATTNTPANLRQWIKDPDSIKPGSLMPAMHLNEHDLDAVTAYLSTLQ